MGGKTTEQVTDRRALGARRLTPHLPGDPHYREHPQLQRALSSGQIFPRGQHPDRTLFVASVSLVAGGRDPSLCRWARVASALILLSPITRMLVPVVLMASSQQSPLYPL